LSRSVLRALAAGRPRGDSPPPNARRAPPANRAPPRAALPFGCPRPPRAVLQARRTQLAAAHPPPPPLTTAPPIPRARAITFAFTDGDGAAVQSMCPGGTYGVSVKFGQPRLALLTSSAGYMGTDKRWCGPSPAARKAARGQTGARPGVRLRRVQSAAKGATAARQTLGPRALAR
jgi:hypothetical protein